MCVEDVARCDAAWIVCLYLLYLYLARSGRALRSSRVAILLLFYSIPRCDDARVTRAIDAMDSSSTCRRRREAREGAD